MKRRNEMMLMNGTRAYVTNTFDVAKVIDTDPGSLNFNTVIATVTLGDGPSGVAITPEGNADAGAAVFLTLGVVRVEPAIGLTTGGTTVAIYGHKFEPGASVSIGGSAATNVVRHSATLLAATTPLGTAGLSDVVVTNPDLSTATLVGGFRYLDPAADDDGDGLTNVDEIALFGTNPLVADSDGDGFSDAAEVAAGTSPTNPNSIPGATVVGGLISANTTWLLADSPFRVTNHIIVTSGVTLTIEPGVVVEFAGFFFLQVDGTLRAVGSAPITFKAAAGNSVGWDRLRFTSTSVPFDSLTGTGSVLEFVTIRDLRNGISLSSASPRLANLDVASSGGGINGSAHPTEPLLVENNRIHDTGIFFLSSLSGNVLVEGNEFFNVPGGQNCLVSVSGTGAIFRHNFVHDNGVSLAVCAGDQALVEFNTIANNGEAGIALRSGSGQVIQNNTLLGHGVNLMIIGNHGATISNNNFIGPLALVPSVCGGNRQFHVAVANFSCGVFGGGPAFPGGGVTLLAANNFWNTTDPAQIAAAIRDSEDDLTILATVDFQPFLTAATNNLPVANAGPDQPNVSVGQLVQLDGTGSTDPDVGDLLTFRWFQSAGPAVTLTAANTATPTFTAPDGSVLTFSLTVSDGAGGFASDSVNITVIPNQPPVANSQSVMTLEDTPVNIVLTGSDADGNPLTFAVVSNPTNGTLTGTAPNLTYTPDPDFFGPDSFTFTVNDGTVDSAPASVSITVDPVNDPPFFDSISNRSVLKNPPPQDVIITGVSAGPANEVGQTVILTATSNNTAIIPNPTVSAVSDGLATLTYQPAADAMGTVTITVTANDGQVANNTFFRTFTIAVTDDSVNNALAAGANRLVDLQNLDGGWFFAASDPDCGLGPDSCPSTFGLTALGLVDAVNQEQDPVQKQLFLNAATATANALVDRFNAQSPKEIPFAQDVEFLVALSQASGNLAFRDTAQLWFQVLVNQFPNPGDVVDALLAFRDSQGLRSLAAWDVAAYIRAATAVGDNVYATGLVNRIIQREVDMGMLKGWRDTASPRFDQCPPNVGCGPPDNLFAFDLTLLAEGSLLKALQNLPFASKRQEYRSDLLLQQEPNGSWDLADLQITAWAGHGLGTVGEDVSLRDAIAFLVGNQLVSGGWPWFAEPRGVGEEFTQVNSEVMQALALLLSKTAQVGANVTVQPSDTTEITFDNVSAPGTTTVTGIDPADAGTVPGGFEVDIPGAGNLAFQISTDATVTGPITVCFNVPSVNDPVVFSDLRILHREEVAPGVFELVDRTILPPDSPAPDFATRTICARVDSLSPFVVVQWDGAFAEFTVEVEIDD
ncbi:Ig-like domain-containing protein, partial [Acidobacteria bacterium AH-259-L09]|nr:Ig-like domain-containing protein [Acidobacteria bacterium AH-259-L09]